MKLRAFIPFVTVILFGCTASRSGAPPLSPDAGRAISASAEKPRPHLGAETHVPSSSAETPLSSKWHIVIVSKTAISVDAGPPIVTLPVGELRDGLYIAPLGDVLRAMDHGHDLAFAFEPSTSYELVTQTLYTAGMTGMTAFHLVVRRNGAATEFVSHPSPLVTVTDAPSSLRLVVSLASDGGISMRVRGVYVGPGCALPPPKGAELPPKGTFDRDGLAACAAKLRARYPEAEERVVIGAAPSVIWQDVVRMADALRASADGTPLFPDVEWGAAR